MRDVGYLTSNANTAWPFFSNDPALDLDVARLFADGSIKIYPEERISKITVSDVVVIAGTMMFTVNKVPEKISDEMPVISKTFTVNATEDTVYSVVNNEWCFFVLENHEVLKQDIQKSGPYAIDPSACVAEADRITSISLYNYNANKEKECTTAGIKGDIILKAGYNTYIGDDFSWTNLYSPTVFSKENTILIAAEAGAGMGTVPCESACEEDVVPYKGSFRPDTEGNVVIDADQCYQISPDQNREYTVIHTKVGESYIDNVHILLTGRCTACCQCDDFVKLNDRLADESQSLLKANEAILETCDTYNTQAQAFNTKINAVKTEELIARVVVMGQHYSKGNASALNVTGGNVSGSIDRAQAVISLKNMSATDVTAAVRAVMKPQTLAFANILIPNGTGATWTTVRNKTIECRNGVFYNPNIEVPAGSGVTIRIYGAKSGTVTTSPTCEVSGFVLFSWREEMVCPEDGTETWPDIHPDWGKQEWTTAFDVDSNDGIDPDYTAHFGDFLVERDFPESSNDIPQGSPEWDSNDSTDVVVVTPDDNGKCWITRSLLRRLTTVQET